MQSRWAGMAATLAMAAVAGPVAAEKIDYKTANLECTFTHHCYAGRSLTYNANVPDYSNCDKVTEVVRWNTETQTLSWRGRSLQIINKRQRRVGLTIRANTGKNLVQLATGRKSASLSFTSYAAPTTPVTDYYPGLCKRVN